MIVLLHGWPGDPEDWREVIPLLDEEPVVPELLWHPDVSAATLAQRVADLIDEPAVICGYDVGSRVAQAVAPEKVRALVLAPPLPGAGDRVLTPEAQREFWYQAFHQLDLAEQLVDGNRDAVRAYLRHFWRHWSGPGFELPEDHLERLTDRYAQPGAFTKSIGWYRAGSGMVAMSLAETPPEQRHRRAHDRALARARSLVPARVGRSPPRVLRGRHRHRPARGRSLLAARGARRLGG